MIRNKVVLKTIQILFIYSFIVLSLVSCKKRGHPDLLERMKLMEDDGGSSLDLENKERSEQLEKDILYFSDILNKKIEAGDKLGTYYKLIGLKYLDYSMYFLALEAFERALEIYPENPNILCYAGLASSRLGKTAGSDSEEEEFLAKGVRYYRASLSFKGDFSPSLYGLAIVYVYELDQPELAIPLLETYNKIQKSSMKGRFLLAAAHFAMGNRDLALDIYNYIIDKSTDDTEIESASNNRNTILRGQVDGL